MSVSIRRLFAAAVCFVAAAALAHQDDAAQSSPALMDCDHQPEQAVRELPEPVNAWTALDCRAFGQLLVQKDGWVWRYPASFTDQVLVPAWTASAENADGGAHYFKAFAVETYDGEEAAQLHERFTRELATYRMHATRAYPPAPSIVYTLVAENDLGHRLRINFLYRSSADIWAVTCAPECRPESVFHVYRRE
jgi:hypothetical protein